MKYSVKFPFYFLLIQEILQENKLREFHANPLPNFKCKLPKKKPTKLTSIEPFHLQSEERSAAYKQAWEKKVPYFFFMSFKFSVNVLATIIIYIHLASRRGIKKLRKIYFSR